MTIATMRRVAAVFIGLLVLSHVSAEQRPFPGIVVFGTSLSDPGNAFHIRGGVNHPPEYLLGDFMVPSAPYTRGGHHLSNGAVWIVQMARPLGLAGSVQPAYRSANPKATNYAVDRARARDDGLNVNLSDQVQQFLEDFGGEAPADWLYVVEFGSNDVRDALLAYVAGGPSAANVVIQGALTSIGTRLAQLYAAGARNFLIANVPDVSLTPGIAIAEQAVPGATVLAHLLVGIFNTQLEGTVIAGLPSDADVTLLDLYGRLNEIVDAPEDFGLTNITAPCIQPNDAPFVCQHPDEYLFWDGVHPTSAVHALLAQLARDALDI